MTKTVKRKVKIGGKNFMPDQSFKKKSDAQKRAESIRTGQYSVRANPRIVRVVKKKDVYQLYVGTIRRDISTETWAKYRKMRDRKFKNKKK